MREIIITSGEPIAFKIVNPDGTPCPLYDYSHGLSKVCVYLLQRIEKLEVEVMELKKVQVS